MSSSATVFVTVGTTLFDSLIEQFIDDPNLVRTLCLELGYQRLVLQIGRSAHEPDGVRQACLQHVLSPSSPQSPFQVEVYRYKNDLSEDVASAALIISHAGAGSCVEALSQGGSSSASSRAILVVVVNDLLMHNHQWELAHALERDKFAFACASPNALVKFITSEEAKATLTVRSNDKQGGAVRELWRNGDQEKAMERLMGHLDQMLGFS